MSPVIAVVSSKGQITLPLHLSPAFLLCNTSAMESDPTKESRPVQQSLFDDIPIDPAAHTAPQASPEAALGAMVRKAGPKAEEQSPLQRKFDKLVRRIEELRESIALKTREGDAILDYWAKELAPILPKIASEQVRLAFAIDKQANGFKLGVRQRASVAQMIVGLLDDAFNRVEAGEADAALYSRWSETSFEEEVEAQGREAIDGLREAFREGFGIDLDEETLARGPEAITEALLEEAKKMEGESFGFSKPRKKTAKQLAKEELERQAEAQAQKGLRSLYLSLVKVLHPDIEPDLELREIKERTMKDLTSAYEAGDIHTLLRMEMEWLARESASGSSLPEDKLKAYIATLSSQVEDLEEELEFLSLQPRFGPISEYIDDDLEFAMIRIDIAAGQARGRLNYLVGLADRHSGTMEKQAFIGGIQEMLGG